MRNIVFVNDAFFGGGAEKSMRVLLDKLPKKRKVKYELIILEAKNYLKITDWCNKRDIKVILLTNTKNIFILKLLQLIYIPFFIAWKYRKKRNFSIFLFDPSL